MKKILLIFIFPYIISAATCLTLSHFPVASCSGNDLSIQLGENNFPDSLSFGTNNTLDIPLYIYSNNTRAIRLKFENLTNLIHTDDNTDISASYHYISGSSTSGTSKPIVEGEEFNILPIGSEYRDGNTIVGYIRVTTSNLSNNQTAGKYITIPTITLGLLKRIVSNSFNILAKVDDQIRVGFTTNIGTIGFEGAEISLGTLPSNQYINKTLDIYVKNNTYNGCTMSIELSTLKHVIYPEKYQIPITYSFINLDGDKHAITSTEAFALTNTKNDATIVGKMEFTIQAQSTQYLAGHYEAIVPVTIKAQ